MLVAAAGCQAVLFVGTWFSVGVTDLMLYSALERGVPVVSIAPGAAAPAPGVIARRTRAEEVLPAVCEALGN